MGDALDDESPAEREDDFVVVQLLGGAVAVFADGSFSEWMPRG
ncbi:hypothetical protein SEA_EMOTION_41 [Arthrobacter phage Emotion]|uniref:Uncharacterized protein n=1 Tax=Arthrobacter phage Emotion TaxID=3038361 RepID=A0AA49ES67_9CAUD|nr:hypothetical protein SEA_EMOTION_41 [Arthrobacter phage Emotion]